MITLFKLSPIGIFILITFSACLQFSISCFQFYKPVYFSEYNSVVGGERCGGACPCSTGSNILVEIRPSGNTPTGQYARPAIRLQDSTPIL